MKLSVALCTYNGSKYIEKQLLSIINQELSVDEIVVCDDGSTDDTMQKVHAIAEAHKEIHWVIEQNRPNLGFCNNFGKAFSLCKGDIIFLSDQDDIWYPNKSKIITSYFHCHKDKTVIFSNAHLMDSNDNTAFNGQTLFQTVGFSEDVQKQFDKGWALEYFAYENHATGCTMAFRKSFMADGWNVSSTRKDRFGNSFHDIQLVFKALETDSLGYIPEILTRYRIHGNQACGLGTWISNPLHFGKVYKAIPAPLTTTDVPENLLKRMQFLAIRHSYTKSILGYKILTHFNEYRHYYGSNALAAIYSDFRQHVINTIRTHLK